ncbi:YxeA family protein [Listeria ivanovii]|uniref:YxeA family protein n=1 Tax=Listeria ivanovii (strain ATCC BAA-678 / PAM 55) TaxID=881621 RepID=G2ZF44_LISIP|nr:YxeA family protein [Listeria ivanovii]AHI56867.1 hypothetical protein AX25_12565 [Listeria ivanovii WSLC3009]AIS66285.1 hypothetical protein JL52_12385 [Listeria ivanovii subsp. ivanovii]MBC1759919.1 YxeA family protein [Listeria ivanovii]MBK3915168.1 YxeA family protein [Listeria ivanovii subsp. ivanovii]MBK3922208.1 YxeA family protein [Listeria ivanovii subsp. ivanovii]
MKKIFIGIISLLILGGIGLGIYYYCYDKIAVAEQYYVKITKDGENTGDRGFAYSYVLSGYNKDGEEEKMNFKADKNLRKGAYLRLYYKNFKGVTTFEEVTPEQVPNKAAEKLN